LIAFTGQKITEIRLGKKGVITFITTYYKMPKRRHQIELELENPFLMFPLPSFNVSRQNAGEVNEEQETARSFSKLFSKLSGKGLTDQNANVLLEIFPLLGAVL